MDPFILQDMISLHVLKSIPLMIWMAVAAGERTNFHWWTRQRNRTNCDESLRRNAIVVVVTLKYANTHTPERRFLWLNGRPFWLLLCKWKGVRSPFYSPLLVNTHVTHAHTKVALPIEEGPRRGRNGGFNEYIEIRSGWVLCVCLCLRECCVTR